MKTNLSKVFGCGLVMLIGVHTWAATDTELPEYVVRATREGRLSHEIAASATVLTGEQIRQAGYVTLVEGLSKLGGVYIRSTTANPTSAEVSMRGFGENSHGRVLVLLNGRRVNRPDLANINWLQIPLAHVERVEIIRGHNTALYGDNAIAGVISITTKKGAAEPVTNVGVDVGSYQELILRAGAAGSMGKLSYAANAERYETDGYRDHGGYMAWGAGANLGYAFSDSREASLGVSWQSVDSEFPGDLSKAQMKDDPTQSVEPDGDGRSLYFNVDAGLRARIADDHSVDVDVGYGQKDLDTDMVSFGTFTATILDTVSASPRYTFSRDFGGICPEIMVGADFHYDNMRIDQYREPSAWSGPVNVDATVRKRSEGWYARAGLGIADCVRATAAYRAEWAEVEVDSTVNGVETVDEDKVHTGNAFDASLLWNFCKRSKVFVRGGSIYRYPFVDEQASYLGFGTDVFYRDIEAEKGWNAELGAEWGGIAGVSVGGVVFYSELEDEIGWNAATFRNENLDDTRRWGAETDVTYACRYLTINGNYTYVEARFTDGMNSGNDVPLVPREQAALGVQVPLPLDLRFDSTARYVGDSNIGGDNANTQSKLSDYIVVDLFLRYVSSALDGLEAYVGAENVFDEQYASFAYWGGGWGPDAYYPSPGVLLRGGVSYRF